MNTLVKTLSLAILLIVILSIQVKGEYSAHQQYFKVKSELGSLCDSLYIASAAHNLAIMDRLYKKTEEYNLSKASLSDSMGYFLSRGLYEYLTDKLDISVKSLYTADFLATKYNDQHYAGIVGNHLGNAYYLLKDNKKALEYYTRVAHNHKAPSSARSSVLNNISVVCMEQYQKEENTKIKDSLARVIDDNYALALAIQKANNDFTNLAGTMSVMIPWFQARGLKDSAYHYVKLCRNLAEKHQMVGRIAFLQIKLGSLLTEDGKYQAAIDTIQKAVDFYEKQKNHDQVIHAIAMQTIALDLMGKYKESKEKTLRMYQLLGESFSKKRADALGEYEARFNTQQKEIENQKLIAENKYKKLNMNKLFLTIISLIAILFAAILFYRNKLKKEQLQLKAQELLFKNKLIENNMKIEEKERSRIARELHDGVGQQISSIKLGLDNIEINQQKGDEKIMQLQNMVVDVLHSVRGISHQMMPIALQRFGLIKAIESLVDFLNTNCEIHFSFESFSNNKLNLTNEAEVHIYRIIQELTTNINKHSKASIASIQLLTRPSNLLLIVSDNGIGMPQNSQLQGMGFNNIKTRLDSLNGKIDSEYLNGENIIKITIPNL